MSSKVLVILEDDLDGGKADETVEFGLDGTSYAIDLSDANAKKLRDTLDGYVSKARKTGGVAAREGTALNPTSRPFGPGRHRTTSSCRSAAASLSPSWTSTTPPATSCIRGSSRARAAQ
jgi:hypothetical protein